MPFPFRVRANPGGTEHSGTACAALRVHLHTALSPHALPPCWAAQVKAIEDLTFPSGGLSGLPEVSAAAKVSPRHETVTLQTSPRHELHPTVGL